MNTNNLSLNDLYDIVEPAPVSWWPLAPGWWVLIAVVLAASGYLLFRHLQCRRKNAYRREALTELEQAKSASEIATILRRTALAAYPRKAIASLHGEEWIEWLETTVNLPMQKAAQDSLASVYSENPTDGNPLRNYTKQWIRQHPSTESGTC